MQDQAAPRVATTEAGLLAALDEVRGAVLAAFPRGLPPWDPVRRGMEGAPDQQACLGCARPPITD